MTPARRGRTAVGRAVLCVALALLALHAASPPVAASHAVELDPDSAPPSSPVTVTADPVSEPCEVAWGATGEALIDVEDCAAPGGELSATIVVPPDATPGPHEVVVCSSGSCGAEIVHVARAPIQVEQPPAGQVVGITVDPEIELLPTVGPPGTVVRVTVTGVGEGRSVVIGWFPGPDALLTTADEDGTARGELLVLRSDAAGPRTVFALLYPPGQFTSPEGRLDPRGFGVVPRLQQEAQLGPEGRLEASFLITHATAQPPDFTTRR